MKKTGIFAPKTQFFPFKTQCTAGLRPELSCRKVYKKKPVIMSVVKFKSTVSILSILYNCFIANVNNVADKPGFFKTLVKSQGQKLK